MLLSKLNDPKWLEKVEEKSLETLLIHLQLGHRISDIESYIKDDETLFYHKLPDVSGKSNLILSDKNEREKPIRIPKAPSDREWAEYQDKYARVKVFIEHKTPLKVEIGRYNEAILEYVKLAVGRAIVDAGKEDVTVLFEVDKGIIKSSPIIEDAREVRKPYLTWLKFLTRPNSPSYDAALRSYEDMASLLSPDIKKLFIVYAALDNLSRSMQIAKKESARLLAEAYR